MKKINVLVGLIIGVLLMSTFALANGEHSHESEIEEGRKLVESEINCDELSDEQLETIGEYLMEQMHPGEAHEAMHKMMGMEEGTEYHEQVHVNMAKMMYCGESGMMAMMPMMMNMMGGGKMIGYGMMGKAGYGFGYWNFVNVLHIILLIGLIILVYLWILRLWKNMNSGKGKKRR